MELVRRVFVLAETEHGVFEREEHPRLDVEGKVQIERSAAALLGVQVHLPHLSKRVGLDEMALVVDVEPVVHRVIFQVGHIAGDVDCCHRRTSLAGRPEATAWQGGACPLATTWAGRVALWTTRRCSRC